MNDKESPKILLVDDDQDMCESLADVLSVDSSYIVSFTTEPLKALEMVRSEDFDLIIIDYKMPDMNGLDLMKAIRKVKSNSCPIIFIFTAFISTELVDHARKEGASQVLSKFIWPDELLRYIKKAVG